MLAAFDTREAAEAWLKKHPAPPSSAYVLVADPYHQLVYNRELNHRRVFPHPVLEYFRPGIYAVGDVRSGLEKRVAASVGESSMVVQALHGFLHPGGV